MAAIDDLEDPLVRWGKQPSYRLASLNLQIRGCLHDVLSRTLLLVKVVTWLLLRGQACYSF